MAKKEQSLATQAALLMRQEIRAANSPDHSAFHWLVEYVAETLYLGEGTEKKVVLDRDNGRMTTTYTHPSLKGWVLEFVYEDDKEYRPTELRLDTVLLAQRWANQDEWTVGNYA